MNCKNCGHILNEDASFCEQCGAKIIRERITLKAMINQLMTDVLGWDNKYFKTISHTLVRPKEMFESYLGGTRKRYMNPIGFMIIGLTFSIFIFNSFHEQYINISVEAAKQQMTWLAENFSGPYKDVNYQKQQLEFSKKTQEIILKYFNLLTFLMLPFYALLSKITFGKPLNYAEHLSVNTYLQGVSFVFTPILFMLSVWIDPNIFLLGLILTMVLYSYVYMKLYNLSFAEIILKLLIFLGLLMASLILFTILAAIITIIVVLITKSDFFKIG